MQKNFEIEQGVPEIWGFKGLEIILLCETKKEEKIPLCKCRRRSNERRLVIVCIQPLYNKVYAAFQIVKKFSVLFSSARLKKNEKNSF